MEILTKKIDFLYFLIDTDVINIVRMINEIAPTNPSLTMSVTTIKASKQSK